eukprot:8524232-Karenia_brevis.AAC.1
MSPVAAVAPHQREVIRKKRLTLKKTWRLTREKCNIISRVHVNSCLAESQSCWRSRVADIFQSVAKSEERH